MRMNLIHVHVTIHKDKGFLMSQGQNLANENKFSFCAPRPGLLLLLEDKNKAKRCPIDASSLDLRFYHTIY